MATNLLKSGLNTVVDEVESSFNVDFDSVFPTTTLETGAPKKFPKDLDAREFGGLKIEFTAYELEGLRLGEKIGGGVTDAAQGFLEGIQTGLGESSIGLKINSIADSINDQIGSIVDSIGGGLKNAITDLANTASNIWERDPSTAESLSLVAAKGLTERGKWQLFVPQNISTSYGANWKQTELNFLGQALESATKAIPQAVGDAAKLLNGEAINPMSELLFTGIDHRTFSYTFTLFPKNADETNLLKELVYFFKCHMTPELSPNTANIMLRYPDYFKIRYLYNNADNPWLNKIAYCVLTRFNVAYQANLPAFNYDGSPQGVTISMEFREIEPIYRQFIVQGY